MWWLLWACAPAGDGRSDVGSIETEAPAPTGQTGSPSTTTETTDTTEPAPVRGPGPCAAYGEAEWVGEVIDPALDEISGLVVSRQNPGVLWVHEDSGGPASLVALAPSGETLATVPLVGVENVDWEDLALAPCADGWCLTVGDIGTLGTDRSEFALLTVVEPLLGSEPLTDGLAPTVRPFTYPDAPEDSESLVVTEEGTAYLASKRSDGTSNLYALYPGDTVLTFLATVATGAPGEGLAAEATAADWWSDPPTLLLRSYFHLAQISMADWTQPGAPEALAYAIEPQGEAVAWDPVVGGFWQISEWANPRIWHTPCATP